MASKKSPAPSSKPFSAKQIAAAELAMLTAEVRGPQKPKMTPEQIKIARGGGFA